MRLPLEDTGEDWRQELRRRRAEIKARRETTNTGGQMSEAPNEQGVIHTDEPQEPPALPAEATGDHETLTVRKLGWVVGTASSKGKLAALLTSADRKQEAITKAKARAQKRADVSGNVIRLVVCDSDGNPQRGYYFHPTPPSEDD